MPEKSTFIKLNRKILKWRWYQDSNTFRVFVHLLLTANITDRDFGQVTVKRGQLVTSVAHLSQGLGISVKSIRTALEHLKSTNEVAIKTTSKYSIITINNYNEYQKAASTLANEGQTEFEEIEKNFESMPFDPKKTANKTASEISQKHLINTVKNDSRCRQATKLMANNGQTTGKRGANEGQQYKNDKECKRMIKNERGATLAPLGRFKNVLLAQNELNELKTKFPNDYEAKIERLSRYLESTGKKYCNHFSTLLDWLEQDTASQSNIRKPSYNIDELDKFDSLENFK